MTHIHYKFSSKLSYDTVVFDGPHITLRDLKRQIMGREKLRAGDCDLQITNAQSKEEYIDDEGVIPKGSSVIVRRIPVSGGKSRSSSRTSHIETSAVQFHHAFVKAMDDQSSSRALPFLAKMANLAEADVSEEDKIKVILNQSPYDSMNYKKFGSVLPANYTCYRCGNTGHHISNCPTSGQDKNFEAPLRIRKSTGIPRSFMVEVDDPNMKGAMLTNSGRYAIPAIDAEAYAIGKKEKPPFIPQEKLKSEAEEDPVPDELLCLICRDLLSDAVVIPCCGNCYCDDCIRTTLLDSEEHICPTCSQSDVSPDTLTANKFLRQAVNNFKKERGYTKGLKRTCGASQSHNLTTRPSPVTTPPPIIGQSQPPKPLQPTYSRQVNQDSLQHHPNVADALPLSGTPLVAATSADSTPSTCIEPEQSCLEIPDKKAEEKTQDDSVAVDAAPSVPVSVKEPSAAPSQWITVVSHTAVPEQPQTITTEQQQSSSSSLSLTQSPCGPPTCWDRSSSSRVWTGSQLNSSCSSYSAPTPPLFPSPIFLSAHQSHRSYPPGYQPTMPLWPVPSPQGTPIPSLCSSTSTPSIPSLIPDDWYRHQRKNERPPHRESSYRQSSSRSNSKSSKSRMSHIYANTSSRSRSRSRSKSQCRSRHRSPYSRHRDLHTRHRPCSTYSYGYKRSRSPTPSSSSSPRVGYYSRSKSPSEHQKKGHHSRHQSSKKSTSSSYSSQRRGEQSERETGGSAASLASPLFSQHTNQTDSLDLDRERYLQWKEEYKEWCEKYFSSYVGHFHQLPLPVLNLLPPPPPPPPQWVDKEGSTNNSLANSDSHYQPQGRHTSQLDCHSPSSHSSSGSRSPSRSSSDSNSTPSQSCSESDSSPSHASTNSPSPPSPSSSDGLSTRSETGAQLSAYQQKYSQLSVTLSKTIGEVNLQDRSKEDQAVNLKYLEDFSSQKHDQRRMKRREEGRAEKSSSPAVVGYDECKDACKDGTSVQDEATACDTLKSVQSSLKPIRPVDRHSEREHREKQNLKGWRTGKQSDARQDVERSHKAKPSKDTDDRVDTDLYRNLRGRERAETRSEKNRKRKGEELERHETQRKGVSPNPIERKMQHREKKKEIKTQPLTDSDIWEEGIKVKPQKKISININLDGTRSKINQDFSCSQSTAGKTNEENEETGNGKEGKGKPHKEVSRTKEGLCDKLMKPAEVGASKTWEKGTFKVVEIRETFAGEEDHAREKKDREDEDFDLWHCAIRGVEEEEESRRLWEVRDGIRDSKGKEVTERRSTGKREGKERIRNESHEQEETELVRNSQKQGSDGKSREITLEELKTNRKEGLMEGVKKTSRKQEDDTMSTPRSHNPNTAVDDGSSCEDHQERTVTKTPEENTQERATEREGERMLVKVPFSKWDKVSVEEEQDKAQDTLPVSVPPPLVVTTNQEKEHNRWRSLDTERDRDGQMQRGRPNTEMGKDSRLSGINRAMAPSSSRCRTDSTMCTDKERQRGIELERRRERGKEGERPRDRQKEGKASKEKRREDEGERYRRTERGHSSTVSGQKRHPVSSGSSSSSSSASRDTERRDWQRQSDQGSESKYFHPSGSDRKDRCSTSAAVELPDKNACKIQRGMTLDLKSKDKQQPNNYHNHEVLSHNYRRQDRDPLSSESFSLKPRASSSRQDLKQNKSSNESMEEKGEWTQNRVNKVVKESKTKRERREMGAEREGGSRGEDIKDNKLAGESMWDWRRELEEGERSSSNSSSSASMDNSRKERKKHRREKRQAAWELLEPRKNTERREDGGVDVDDGGNEEENQTRLCSVTLS